MNSLDLNCDIKNIFWHEPVMKEFFDTCDYVSAVPTIQGYNHGVLNKLFICKTLEIQKGDVLP